MPWADSFSRALSLTPFTERGFLGSPLKSGHATVTAPTPVPVTTWLGIPAKTERLGVVFRSPRPWLVLAPKTKHVSFLEIPAEYPLSLKPAKLQENVKSTENSKEP